MFFNFLSLKDAPYGDGNGTSASAWVSYTKLGVPGAMEKFIF